MGEVGLGVDKSGGQLRQLKLAPQSGHGTRQIDSRKDSLDLGDKQDPGQEQRPGGSKEGGEPSLHAAGIDQETDTGEVFRRPPGMGIEDSLNHHLREVGPGRDSEHAADILRAQT